MLATSFRLIPLAVMLAVAASSAQASNANASLTIVQDNEGDDASWTLDLSGLFTAPDANGVSVLDLTPNASVLATGTDAGTWTVNNDASGNPVSLTWHSWTTANGGDASSWSQANPWAAVVTFTQLTAVGDPELYYGVGFRNNSNVTQTYTFGIGETMDTPMSGPYTLYANVAGTLTSSAANPNAVLAPVPSSSTLQTVLLGNGGIANVNGGVDVGTAQTNSGAPGTTLTWGQQDAYTNGSGSFDYWEMQAKVTLTAKNSASMSGYAQITQVPEAGTYGMLLAGLAAVGWVARRRR